MAALGLRGKSLLALLLSCLLAFAFAGFIGYQALEGVQSRFGEAYAKNLVQLNRERVFAPVSRELALAQRLAGSQITLAWLQNEQDPAWRELFFREAAAFQQTLISRRPPAVKAITPTARGRSRASSLAIDSNRATPVMPGSSRRYAKPRPTRSMSTALSSPAS